MDNFWTFLEAMAGIFDEPREIRGQTIEHLQKELRQMPKDEREKMAGYLNAVSEGISNLATMASQNFERVQ